MQKVTSFEDLIAWQKARLLTAEVSKLIELPPLDRKWSYRDQLHRASVSVMSNIAEGFERGTRAEFAHFLATSKASCGEVRSLLYAALDDELIDTPTFRLVYEQTEEVSRIVGGLRASVIRQRDEDRRRK